MDDAPLIAPGLRAPGDPKHHYLVKKQKVLLRKEKKKTKSNFIVTPSYDKNLEEIQEIREGRQNGRTD